MRFTLLALIGVVCLAYTYALADIEAEEQYPDAQLNLLSLEMDGNAHENEGLRQARQVWRGGYGRGLGWAGGRGGLSSWGGRGGLSSWGGRGGRWGGRRWGGGW
ncbi:PREDICTED: rRNA 2'-O-methyltransferase fibrillarin-like [Drosophila arizonae]|uniref:rRNA 2'-O-methyltransferase fibrillarin-like n=1 Tax=Drosophila arizonae TaxID=7263 RepID=A0ABM1PNA3_DROAR|nr:PREDICTED: rRNA 2'-O-methyltransferase fibrillarin-like [Drosophila arizonae]